MDSSPQTPHLCTTDHHSTIKQQSDKDSTHQLSKQPMFEKPLTPSDVGKLNRLVIPKKHAKKYFPLPGVDSGVDQQKGFLLSFEDETGKPWRFRYSYWNSSQSYVLTKGWSRYVKEKRLDAGDVVLFERHRFDGDRMLIGWRRKHAAVQMRDSGGAQVNGWNPMMVNDAQDSYPAHYHTHPCQHAVVHAGGINDNVESKRYVEASGNTRRIRLFGVNLECPDEYEPSAQDGSSQSGQSHIQYSSGSNNLSHNMVFKGFVFVNGSPFHWYLRLLGVGDRPLSRMTRHISKRVRDLGGRPSRDGSLEMEHPFQSVEVPPPTRIKSKNVTCIGFLHFSINNIPFQAAQQFGEMLKPKRK